MKRFLFAICVVSLCGAGSLSADENVRAAQSRLKEGGFYFGEANGVYDSETTAAVSRYQIRKGLGISGKLDAETLKSLSLPTAKIDPPTPSPGEDVWRYLRKSDQEFLKRLEAEEAARNQSRPPITRTESARTKSRSPSAFGHERLRDYVGAFVLAGLDPQVGAELEFFADRVNYFGKGGVARDKIRRDLERYNQRWPDRRFWLAGDLDVDRGRDGRVRVTFPLRYELRSRSNHSSGKVYKTLVLEETGDDLQIVAVNERKTK